MKPSTPLVLAAKPHDWLAIVKAQQEIIRTGQYQRFGVIDVLCFEFTEISNPLMAVLGAQKNAQGRPAWPGIHFDWLNQGPEIGLAPGQMISDGPVLILPTRPFPLPPDAPDPMWVYSEADPMPKLVPQRIEDRAMRIKGSAYLIIQPVVQIHWKVDVTASGHARKEVHDVKADSNGLHMAFIFDTEAKTAHLIGGRVV